ncbi:MAG: hypothetical protein ACLGGY_05180 [Gammaproteobacteria bacterium]
MNMSECLTLLALIMALSAYVSSVRARMLDRANVEDSVEKCKHIRAVAQLIWIDAPLVVSGLLLLSYVMMWQLGDIRFDGVLSTALLVFAFAAIAGAVFHACEWCKSMAERRACKGK